MVLRPPNNQGSKYLSTRPKQSKSMLDTMFTASRIFDVLHTFQGRIKAERIAHENQSNIEQGVISGKLENARLGTYEDALEKGLIRPFSEGGIYLGMLNGQPMVTNKDWHITCVAMAGAGKTSSICIPNIITLGLGEKRESTFIFDVKGELHEATAHVRARLDGKPVVVIDDFGLTEQEGVSINFLDDLVAKAAQGKPISEDVASKLALQFGDPKDHGSNAWIVESAIEWNTAYMCHTAELEPENCSPVGMADFSMLTQSEMSALFQILRQSPASDGLVREIAKNWLEEFSEPREQFQWIRGQLQNAWSLYRSGAILRSKRSHTSFDITTASREVTTIYYRFPANKIRSHSRDAIALLDYLLEQLVEADGNVRTTIMADEFSNFPKALSMIVALRLYRSEGIRLFVFSQDENGFAKYKDDGGFALFKENSIGIYFGVDGRIAKDLSEKAGNKSVLIATNSANAGITNTGGLGSQETTTPVLPVSDIAQNFEGQAYIDMRDRIYLVDRPAWWEIPEFKTLIEEK